MSTYYELNCPICEQSGGWFTRQAWGWGNADVLDTMKFLMAHADCGGGLQVLSEYDEQYMTESMCDAWRAEVANPGSRAHKAWPHDDSWTIVGRGATWKEAWNGTRTAADDYRYPLEPEENE